MNPAWDGIAQKAEAAEADLRGDRQRVCVGCVRATDRPLGGIHSEAPCQRCGARPCVGAIVVVEGASIVAKRSMRTYRKPRTTTP